MLKPGKQVLVNVSKAMGIVVERFIFLDNMSRNVVQNVGGETRIRSGEAAQRKHFPNGKNIQLR